VASFDRWEVLARFYEWSPWLWTLVEACDICAALMMACVSFLHFVVHLLVPWLLVFIKVPSLMIIIVMLAMVMPSASTEWWATFVVALLIARCARFVASIVFEQHGALCFGLPDDTLRILSKLLVDPVSFKFGALATLCILARCVASFDRWEVLARFDEWSPWLWALGVACDIFAALMTTCMSFLHRVVHLLVPRLLNFITMVPVTVLVPSTVVELLVVALAIRILTRFIIRVLIETHARRHHLHSLLENAVSEGGKRILVCCDSSNSNQHNGEAEAHHFCLIGQRHLKRTSS